MTVVGSRLLEDTHRDAAVESQWYFHPVHRVYPCLQPSRCALNAVGFSIGLQNLVDGGADDFLRLP